MWQHIVWVGLFIGSISIAAMAWAISREVAYWQTVVFTVLTVSQLFHSLAVRSESVSLFRIGLFTNLPISHTQPLPMFDLAVCLLLSSLVLFAVEIEKWLIRRGIIYAG